MGVQCREKEEISCLPSKYLSYYCHIFRPDYFLVTNTEFPELQIIQLSPSRGNRPQVTQGPPAWGYTAPMPGISTSHPSAAPQVRTSHFTCFQVPRLGAFRRSFLFTLGFRWAYGGGGGLVFPSCLDIRCSIAPRGVAGRKPNSD